MNPDVLSYALCIVVLRYCDLTSNFVQFLQRSIIASPVHVIPMLLVSAIQTPSLVNVMLVLLAQDLNVQQVTIESAINPYI